MFRKRCQRALNLNASPLRLKRARRNGALLACGTIPASQAAISVGFQHSCHWAKGNCRPFPIAARALPLANLICGAKPRHNQGLNKSWNCSVSRPNMRSICGISNRSHAIQPPAIIGLASKGFMRSTASRPQARSRMFAFLMARSIGILIPAQRRCCGLMMAAL